MASGTRAITLSRADGRSPERLKASNPPGFGVRISVPFSLFKGVLLRNTDMFVEDQVRQNRQELKSHATDLGAGGFDTAKPTGEIFLLHEVELTDITGVRAPNSAAIAPAPNWATVVAQGP